MELPEDLVLEILSRLPAKSILRCKCVCKFWKYSISNPCFTKLQLHKAHRKNPNLLLSSNPSFYSLNSDTCEEAVKLKFDFPGVSVVGCCNGLLCITDFKNLVSLWNPSTGEHQQFQDALVDPECGKDKFQNKFIGFGFDPVSEEYKLLIVMYSCVVGEDNYITEYDGYEARIYTLGSNSWRIVRDAPYPPCFIGNYNRVAHVNGVLHWVGVCGIDIVQLSKSIVSFNVGTEKFGKVLWPDFDYDNGGNNSDDLFLGVFQGQLSIFHHVVSECVDIWVMKDYGKKESWTRMYCIGRSTVYDKFDLLDPLVIRENGEIILEIDNMNLLVYDPLSKRAHVPNVHNLPSKFRAIDYVETIISIASLMAGVGVEMQY